MGDTKGTYVKLTAIEVYEKKIIIRAITCWFAVFEHGILLAKAMCCQLCTDYAISHK